MLVQRGDQYIWMLAAVRRMYVGSEADIWRWTCGRAQRGWGLEARLETLRLPCCTSDINASLQIQDTTSWTSKV